MTYAVLKALYDIERELSGRNYAKEHSFQEWLEYHNRLAGGF